ncbi:YccF domain-containing protein [Phenylobacterium sp.]|uniref:YccF domain-containing protein n=1 Tax=Phenylobacterium sp. TaxID=1871053 RepID=UPI00122920D5|nr:YccF domain-containing protein [Phenylobacterium sp.]THD60457.1 MAG: YccF domain-containing protein [Phenylobacterium sp.]
MRLLLNVLWFIFGGWISGTLWIVAGLLFAITIIGLPWTPAAFRLAGFSYWPFGKLIVDRDDGPTSCVLNVLWLVVVGWWLALHHIVIAVVQAISIIGIPFAVQHVKLAAASLAPVGKMVVEA